MTKVSIFSYVVYSSADAFNIAKKANSVLQGEDNRVGFVMIAKIFGTWDIFLRNGIFRRSILVIMWPRKIAGAARPRT